jgi:hypothetical protein
MAFAEELIPRPKLYTRNYPSKAHAKGCSRGEAVGMAFNYSLCILRYVMALHMTAANLLRVYAIG